MSDEEDSRAPPAAGGSGDPPHGPEVRPVRFGGNKESIEYLERKSTEIIKKSVSKSITSSTKLKLWLSFIIMNVIFLLEFL